MNYDIHLTFSEQGLRPEQVLRFWVYPDRDDPRKAQCIADMARLAICEWKEVWAPNLSYQTIELLETAATIETRIESQLDVLAHQVTKDFHLNDPAYQERLDANTKTMARMMRVKVGGDEIQNIAKLDRYIRLILQRPYVSIYMGAYQAKRTNQISWRVGFIEGKPTNPSVDSAFVIFNQASERFYEHLQDAKDRGLL